MDIISHWFLIIAVTETKHHKSQSNVSSRSLCFLKRTQTQRKKNYFPPLESQEKLPCNLKNIIGTYDMITKIQAHGQQFFKTFVLLIENRHGNCYAMVFR